MVKSLWIYVSEFLTHPFKPFFDKHSKILILGSFPSIKSREERRWILLSASKKSFLAYTRNTF